MASHPPIPIMDLADHLERLKANDNLKFSQEYEVNNKSDLLTNVILRVYVIYLSSAKSVPLVVQSC